MITNGVSSIEITMLARIGFSSAGGTRAFFCASVSSTKPNSPACARYRPVRSATPGVEPSARDRPITNAALNTVGATSSSSTSGQRSTTRRQSSSMPMLMKNRPSSTSWNGRMSVSTWCLNSVSEISMPAMNAPSARLRPAISVSQASPSVMNSRFSTNSSSVLRRATSVSQRRITCCPPTSSTAISTAAFRPATSSAAHQALTRALPAQGSAPAAAPRPDPGTAAHP